MKIAVIGAKGLPAKQGGIEHYCEEVYPSIVEQGHEVDLFARPSYTQTPWFCSYNYKGVRVKSLPSLNYRGVDAFTNSAMGAIASLAKSYDIVHFHALGPALFCWLPHIASSSKVVVTCHGLDWRRSKWGKFSTRLLRLGEQTAVRYAHQLVVVSEDLQSYFRKTYGIETTYIPTAPASYADTDPTLPYLTSLGLQPGRYILYLGRMVPEKRPDLLIKAFQSLKPEGWKLVLAGGISDTAEFTSNLLRLASGNNDIMFTGEIHGNRLSEIVRGAGLFVLPSDLEGLPLVMLEAMREGIPVVASDIPPHRQLLGDDRGLLFEAGKLDSCIHVLRQALQDPMALAPMAEKAQNYVQDRYNWENITFENLSLYSKIANSLTHRGYPTSPVVATEEPSSSDVERHCWQTNISQRSRKLFNKSLVGNSKH